MEPGNTQQETQVLPHSWFMDLFTLFLQKHSFIANPVFTGPASLSRRREAADVSNFLSATQSVSQSVQTVWLLAQGGFSQTLRMSDWGWQGLHWKSETLPAASILCDLWSVKVYLLLLIISRPQVLKRRKFAAQSSRGWPPERGWREVRGRSGRSGLVPR